VRLSPRLMNTAPASLEIEAPCPPVVATAVGSQAARGAMWTLLFSSLNKCVALGSQIALARLLVPEQFGLVAMALSVTSSTGILVCAHVKPLCSGSHCRFRASGGNPIQRIQGRAAHPRDRSCGAPAGVANDLFRGSVWKTPLPQRGHDFLWGWPDPEYFLRHPRMVWVWRVIAAPAVVADGRVHGSRLPYRGWTDSTRLAAAKPLA